MKKYTISLCMIVKNEEKYLDRCLKSVQGKVDEIIIVDTGSTDSTIEIAQKYNAVIKHFEWVNDFAAARNYSINDVKTDYILVLDADEYLDENSDLQSDLSKEKDYYRLKIKNYQGGEQILMHQNVRLFKAGVGLSYNGRLHEHLNNYDDESEYSGTDSDILIHHVGYLPEVIADKDKNKRNYDIMIKELQENPDGYSYFNMGMVYLNDKKFDKALDMFKKSYPLSKNKKYVQGLLVHMGECLLMLNRTEDGIKLLEDAIKYIPKYADLHYTLGVLFLNCGYMKDAEREFKECLEIGEKVDNMTIEGVGSYMADYQLALIYEKKGRIGDAFDEAFKSVMENKSYSPALALYLKLMQRSGIPMEEIQKHVEAVYPISTAKELNSLILALYKARHPLISRYDYVLISEKLANIRAVAHMLSGDYKKSSEEWNKMNKIAGENLPDVLVLALINQDISLAEKVKGKLNLSEKEWKYLAKILNNEDMPKKHTTEAVEKLLLDISYYLLDLGAFDQFEYISRFLLECSIETQNKLAARLINLGHSDTALDLLSVNIERYPRNHEVPLLIGDIFAANNDLSAALDYYNKSLGLKEYYPTYESIYEVYEKMGDESNLRVLRSKIKSKFPLVQWVKGN